MENKAPLISDSLPVAPARTPSQQGLYRRTYRFRMLGMGLAAVPIALVLDGNGSATWTWAWLLLSCLGWPHLAWFIARRSRDPFNTELRNLVVDSMIAGSWVALMQFNALPSAMLIAVTTADKISSGVRGLWLRSLPWLALALVATGVTTGFAFAPQTSMRVVLACLPLMVIHTLAVSYNNYRLVRRVQAQNQRLAELNRIDPLSGLENRRHWEERAAQLHDLPPGQPATVMIVDIDHFKAINDTHGHAVGDDVLRAIATTIRSLLPAGSHVGRLGGDEFAVAMPGSGDQAATVAEHMRTMVERLELASAPDLRSTLSIGYAERANDASLREWIERADRALYRAKNAGRNRVMA